MSKSKKKTDKILSRDDILSADDLKQTAVAVPEWGGIVYVRSLTGNERDIYETYMLSDQKTDKAVRAYLAALCIVDENGKRLFSQNDIELLGQKSGAALERVANEALRLNAFTPDDIEDLAKN